MTRQRMVKPEFFDSESLGACSAAARLAFIGLWVMGDDYGNQKAQASRLKMKIFPYDSLTESDFIDLLCELEEVGCIKGYVVDGERYINIPNFKTYQTVRKPSGTNVPDPPKQTVKARTTKVLRQWRNGDELVQTYDSSDTPVKHYDDTSIPELTNERSNFSLREKIAKGIGASEGAEAAKAAPPSAPSCPKCGSGTIGTNSTKQRGDGSKRRLFICPDCAEEVWEP